MFAKKMCGCKIQIYSRAQILPPLNYGVCWSKCSFFYCKSWAVVSPAHNAFLARKLQRRRKHQLYSTQMCANMCKYVQKCANMCKYVHICANISDSCNGGENTEHYPLHVVKICANMYKHRTLPITKYQKFCSCIGP